MNIEKQMNQNLNISELMYNIQTKLSLLSQIQENHNESKKIVEQKIKQSSKQQQTQIDLPMQLLNKKMMQIINQKQSQHHHSNLHTNEKPHDKKRMQINDLQTGTRNIDEIKNNERTGILPKRSITQQQAQPVRQFKQNNSQIIMAESMMNSSRSSSKILTKFDSIQLNYMEKIKSLTFKVSFLQQKLSEYQQENNDILSSLQTYKALYSKKQEDINKEIENRLDDIKQKLIQKFAEECRLKYNEYISQLKQVTTSLNEERKKRKFFQDQNKLLKLQKQNIEQMYKSLLKKQKQWLKLDIYKTRNEINQQKKLSFQSYHIPNTISMIDNHNQVDHENNQAEQYSHIQNRNINESQLFDKENVIQNKKQRTQQNLKVKSRSRSRSRNKSIDNRKEKSVSVSKKTNNKEEKQSKPKIKSQNEIIKNIAVKKNKKSLNKGSSTTQQMTSNELIPFLAKGIQQLKERLKMK